VSHINALHPENVTQKISMVREQSSCRTCRSFCFCSWRKIKPPGKEVMVIAEGTMSAGDVNRQLHFTKAG
jgi:hypothetical protein